jgi:hypothetical protein
MIAGFKRWLGSLPARIAGSHVGEGEHFTGLSSKARFSPDDQLLLRMARAREELGETPVKPLIERNADTFVRPIDFDQDGLPNG